MEGYCVWHPLLSYIHTDWAILTLAMLRRSRAMRDRLPVSRKLCPSNSVWTPAFGFSTTAQQVDWLAAKGG